MTLHKLTLDGQPRRRGDTLTIAGEAAVCVADSPPVTVATEIPCRSARTCRGTLQHAGGSDWTCPECARGYRRADLADLTPAGWPKHTAPPAAFIKIVRCQEHADFFLDGKLYCNTVRCFREKDPHEGAIFFSPSELTPLGPRAKIVKFIMESDWASELNGFCMFWRSEGIDRDDEIVAPGPSQLESIGALKREFGPHAVVVTKANEFLNRVGRAVAQAGLFGVSKRVVYIDPYSHISDIYRLERHPWYIPFYKDDKFAHQKEFRLIFRAPKPSGLLVLPIGDIRDIAVCMKTENIYDNVPRRP